MTIASAPPPRDFDAPPTPFSAQIESIQAFIFWREQNGIDVPLQESLELYERDLEVTVLRDQLGRMRDILSDEFEAHDPEVVIHLRKIVGIG